MVKEKEWSYSKLYSFNKCKHQFKLIYIDKVTPRPSLSTQLLETAHKAINTAISYGATTSRLNDMYVNFWNYSGLIKVGDDERLITFFNSLREKIAQELYTFRELGDVQYIDYPTEFLISKNAVYRDSVDAVTLGADGHMYFFKWRLGQKPSDSVNEMAMLFLDTETDPLLQKAPRLGIVKNLSGKKTYKVLNTRLNNDTALRWVYDTIDRVEEEEEFAPRLTTTNKKENEVYCTHGCEVSHMCQIRKKILVDE